MSKNYTWEETRCAHCQATIPYRSDWSKIPHYCKSCQETQYKNCLACGGMIEYKRYWSHIPVYCSCKGWKTISCANRSCYNQIRYHYEWNKIPEYCEDCRKPQYKACTNPSCSSQVRYMIWWDRAPDYCDNCRKPQYKSCTKCTNQIKYMVWWDHVPEICLSCRQMAQRRDLDVIRGTILEPYLEGCDGYKVTYKGTHWHVNIWTSGAHVSGDVDKFSTEVAGFHRWLHSTKDGRDLPLDSK